MWIAAAVFVWCVAVGLLWQLDCWIFYSCVRGMGRGGVLRGVLQCCLCGRVIALVLGGCDWLFRSSTNNNISVCGWCNFFFFFYVGLG